MKQAHQPHIWIITPTFNAATVLSDYFSGIEQTTYPKDKLTVVVPDGGSTDATVALVEQHGGIVLPNPLKTGEAGKAVGIHYVLDQINKKKADPQDELICLLDSDNIIVDTDWFERMVEPLVKDPDNIGSEPWEYIRRSQDGYIVRYAAMIGGADPVMIWLGHYDRLNTLTGKWTNLPLKTTDAGPYLTWEVNPHMLPTIGANGTIFRSSIFVDIPVNDYLFDVDVLYDYALKHKTRFAKVKIGIVHLVSGTIESFVRKQRRRIQDYQFFQAQGLRQQISQNLNYKGLVLFILSCITIIPLLWQVVVGYWRKPDRAWLFHPLACWLTLWVYGTGRILGKLRKPALADRTHWKQG